MAIASGALRHEIVAILDRASLRDAFTAIVASGDTPESKPSPAPYALAFQQLRDFTALDLQPDLARRWWPCFDQPWDKATLDLYATVPDSNSCWSNGVLVDVVLLLNLRLLAHQNRPSFRVVAADPGLAGPACRNRILLREG